MQEALAARTSARDWDDARQPWVAFREHVCRPGDAVTSPELAEIRKSQVDASGIAAGVATPHPPVCGVRGDSAMTVGPLTHGARREDPGQRRSLTPRAPPTR